MRIIKIFLLVVILPITVFAQWQWVNPKPQANNLKKIFFTDSATGWIVGNSGTILKTVDESTWKYIYDDSIRDNLISVTFLNSEFGWAVSASSGSTDEGSVYKSTNGGENWEKLITINNKLLDVKFINEEIGWAVGVGTILKTSDGGISWNEQFFNPTATFYACYFRDSLNGWAAGNAIFHTQDGGINWDLQNISVNGTYVSISFSESISGWIAGHLNVSPYNASLLRTTDSGNSWFEYAISGAGLTSVTFVNNDIGWLSSSSGNILKTTDGGNNWLTISVMGSSIDHLFFINTNRGWLINPKGVIRKTTDGGINWTLQSSGFRGDIKTSFFIDSLKGTVSQPSGTLMYTQDGGITWSVSHNPPYADYVHDITFVDSMYGYACGYRHNPYPTLPGPLILKTTNGGQTWSGSQPPDFGLGTHLYAIEFTNRQIGFTGTNVIWKSTNGGSNWNIVCTNTGTIFDIFFINPTIGWASAENGKIFKTTNSGNTWNLIGSGQDTVIYSIYFLNENLGWVGGWGGLLMKTTDGGYTWQKYSYGQWQISSIQFIDENNGWAVGDNRLRTTNGGETWESFWMPSEYALYKVQFVNPKLGWFTGAEGSILKFYNDFPSVIETEEINNQRFENFVLNQNYPNPFNPTTKIKYSIPSVTLRQAQGDVKVMLKVYDILGREIVTLVNEEKPSGEYEVEFNGSALPSGVYFYQLRVGGPETSSGQAMIQTKKMILMK